MLNFCNHFDRYFPNTFEQFEQSLNGRSDKKYWPGEDATNEEDRSLLVMKYKNLTTDPETDLRKECRGELKWRVIALPFDAVGRTVFNGMCTIYKIMHLAIDTLYLFKGFNENKGELKRTFKEIPDFGLATLVSPLQPIAKIGMLLVGCVDPKKIYVPYEEITDRRQKEIQLQYDYVNIYNDFIRLSNVAKDCEKSSKTAMDILIAEALFKYSSRWDLIRAASIGIKATLWAVKEPVDIRLEFTKKFKELLLKWRTEKEVKSNDLSAFIKEAFNTRYQKKILQQFKIKPLNKIPFNFGRYAPWLKEAFLKEKGLILDNKEDRVIFDKLFYELRNYKMAYIRQRFYEILKY